MIVFFQQRLHPIIAGLIALTLAVSLGAAIDHDLYYRLALEPRRVWHGEVWRLVTWPFVVTDPLRLLFECAAVYRFGPELVIRWGPARFWRVLGGVLLFAGIGTCLVGLVSDDTGWQLYFGGMLLGTVLVVAWGLQFPEGRVRIYEVLVLSGPILVFVSIGVHVLYALFYGFFYRLPMLLACAAILVVLTRPYEPWLRKLRTLRARQKLGVIRGERHGGPYYPN